MRINWLREPLSKYNKKGRWIILIIISIFFISYSIADQKWFHLGILLAPLFIYLSVEKPFIFPFGLYVFLLPFDNILSVTGSARGATFTKFLGILTILILLLKSLHEKKLIFPNKASICWILFYIYAILSIFWAIDPAPVSSKFSTILGLSFLYLVVSSYKINEGEFNICKWCIMLGGFIAAIYIIYNYEKGLFASYTMRATMEYGERSTDPNLFAFSLLLPLSICIEKILNRKNKFLKVIFITILSIIILGIVVTGSRGSMLGVFIIFITYILFMKQRITLWAILIIVGIIVTSFSPYLFVERWGKAIETGGSGRVNIWDAGLNALKNYWIMGAGLGNFPNAFAEYGHFTPFTRDVYRDPHNIYLETFVELGIVGLSLLILVMGEHYRAIKSRFTDHDANHVMLKAAFWGILLASFFVGTTYLKSFWLLWMMIMMHKNVVEMRVYKCR